MLREEVGRDNLGHANTGVTQNVYRKRNSPTARAFFRSENDSDLAGLPANRKLQAGGPA